MLLGVKCLVRLEVAQMNHRKMIFFFFLWLLENYFKVTCLSFCICRKHMVTHLKGLLKLSLSISANHYVLPDRKQTYFRRLNLILLESFRSFKTSFPSTRNINSNLHKTVPKISPSLFMEAMASPSTFVLYLFLYTLFRKYSE